jgi:hypothetical protein
VKSVAQVFLPVEHFGFWMIRSFVRKRIAQWQVCPQIWGRGYRAASHSAFTEGINVEPVSFPSLTAVVLFTNVPIAPTASAAGVRTEYLLNNLLNSSGIIAVHVVSSSPAAAIAAPTFSRHIDTDKPELSLSKIHFHVIPPNKSRETQDFLTKVSTPDQRLLVLFDRFYAEEMYSFHVHQHCASDAILVLDLQDLHSLRRHRQEWIAQQDREGKQTGEQMGLSNLPLHIIPGAANEGLLRELASIRRSDLTLVCSSAEIDLLSQQYQVPPEKLCLAPLFGSLDKEQETKLPVDSLIWALSFMYTIQETSKMSCSTSEQCCRHYGLVPASKASTSTPGSVAFPSSRRRLAVKEWWRMTNTERLVALSQPAMTNSFEQPAFSIPMSNNGH